MSAATHRQTPFRRRTLGETEATAVAVAAVPTEVAVIRTRKQTESS